MAAETQTSPPDLTSLRLLRLTIKALTWMVAGGTVLILIVYTLFALTWKDYHPSFDTYIGNVCGFVGIGGITALCSLALMKMIEIWAEILDSGHYKTALLEALLTDPVDQAIEQKE